MFCLGSWLATLTIAAGMLLLPGGLLSGPASAQALVLPEAVEATRSIEARYRFDHPVTGRGIVETEWSDVVGRVVERRRTPLDLAGAPEIAVPLDAR